MNWYKTAKSMEKPENWKEMEDWFKKRTNKHIERVQKYCKKIEEYDRDRFDGLIERSKTHDQSKFKDPEMEPYVYITWKYKCKDDGIDFEVPDWVDDKMVEATEHHVLNNRHHPELHCGRKTNLINEKNRDKPPEEIVDATKMEDLDLAEMCGDWLSMSEEKGGHPKDWADKNVNIRWKFTDKQKDLIYELIEEIWN